MPPGWIRWHVEEMFAAIEQVGATVGPDHLSGQKTVVACLELWAQPGVRPVMTPADAHHDFWAALTAGAQGIMIFSWSRRNDDPSLTEVLAEYRSCVAELTGTQGLTDALLFGTVDDGVSTTVLSGPTEAESFVPFDVDATITMPSVNTRVIAHGGNHYLLCSNSTDTDVQVRIDGLDGGSTEITVPAMGHHLEIR